MTTFTIQDFFSRKFENESTIILLSHKSYFSENAVIDYIEQISQYGLPEYLQYLSDNPNHDEISSKDITQLSSIEDCTINMCNVVREIGNPGMSLTEIAVALHADNNYKDNNVALSKYGENQIKTASQLGLATFYDGLWYLTAIGYIFGSLDEMIQRKYLAITILRDPFYSKVILSLLEQDTNIKDYMKVLSESTQYRRTSSCLKVLSFFVEECTIDGISLHKIITCLTSTNQEE